MLWRSMPAVAAATPVLVAAAQTHRPSGVSSTAAACLRVAALGLLAATLASSAAAAHSHKKKGLEIVHPWTFAASGMGGVVQVSMTIKNTSGTPERLLGASTPAAAKVELHQTAAEGPGAPTKPLSAIAIPAGQTVELTRKGQHLVLTGVKRRLDAYGTFKLTLVFARRGRVTVDVMVEENEEAAAHKH